MMQWDDEAPNRWSDKVRQNERRHLNITPEVQQLKNQHPQPWLVIPRILKSTSPALVSYPQNPQTNIPNLVSYPQNPQTNIQSLGWLSQEPTSQALVDYPKNPRTNIPSLGWLSQEPKNQHHKPWLTIPRTQEPTSQALVSYPQPWFIFFSPEVYPLIKLSNLV